MAGRPAVMDRIDIKVFRECYFKFYNNKMKYSEMCEKCGVSQPTMKKYEPQLHEKVAEYNAIYGIDDLWDIIKDRYE